jgi:hypothetical protein
MQSLLSVHGRIIAIVTVFFFLLQIPSVQTDAPSIVITEIGAFESNGYEWIEIYNASSEPIDLTNWKFWEAGVNHGLTAASGTSMILASQAYGLIVQDVNNFLSKYPSTTASIFDSSWGSLNLSGEQIGIKNNLGELVEVFTYVAAPNNRSLERIDPYLPDYATDNWRAHPTSASPGLQNFWFLDSTTDVPVPIITGPTSTQAGTDTLFDGSRSYGIGALNYRWSVSDHIVGTDAFLTYQFAIAGPQSLLLDVTDSRGQTAQVFSDISVTASTSSSPSEPIVITIGDVVINEVLSRPSLGNAEWVEVYNMSTKTLPLAGVILRDGAGTIATLTGSLAGRSFLQVPISGNKLNNGGDIVLLMLDDTVLDSMAYGSWDGATVLAPAEGHTIARTPDGTGAFVRTTVPTPGSANSIIAPSTQSTGGGGSGENTTVPTLTNGSSIRPRDIVINELVSDPESGEAEWVELFNTTDTSIILDGLVLIEGSGARTALTGAIPARGFFVVSPIKGNLNNAGDTVALLTSSEVVLDAVTYGNWESSQETAPVPRKGQSLARFVDGEDSNRDSIDFTVTSIPTKGAPNRIQGVSTDTTTTADSIGVIRPFDATNIRIRITELLPNPSGDEATEEYITLTNMGTDMVDLSGWILGDATKSRYTMSDMQIAPSQSVKLYRQHTKIALNNTGTEVVTLYAPDASVHDTVTYTGPVKDDVIYQLVGGVWRWSTDAVASAETATTGTQGTYQFGELIVYIDTPLYVGVPVSFDASDSTFSEDTDVVIIWAFLDGSTQTGLRVMHTFRDVGQTQVSITILNKEGNVIQVQTIPVQVVVIQPSNVALPSRALLERIVISEVLPNPEGDDMAEFIELYNPTDTAIVLAGLLLDDEEGGSRPYTIPEGTIIPPQAYLVFPRVQTKLALNNTGDEVRLLLPSGDVLTSISFGTAKEGMYYVRMPDGTYVWTDVGSPGYGAAIGSESQIGTKSVTGAFISADSVPSTATIEDLASYPVGAQVSVQGIVAALPGVLGAQFFYIVDMSNAGIQVYLFNKEFPELRIGDAIEVRGEITMSGKEKRIKLRTRDDIRMIGPGKLPEPKTMEISRLTDAFSGWLLGFDAEVTEVKSTYLYIDDGTAELKVYIKKGANIPTRTYTVGELVRAVGILVPTADGVQLLPRSIDDIITTGVTSNYGRDEKDIVTKRLSQGVVTESPEHVLLVIMIALGSIIGGLILKQYHGHVRVYAHRMIRFFRK